MADIIDQVRALIDQGESRAKLAKQAGVDPSDLGKVLAGSKQPSDRFVAKLSLIVTAVEQPEPEPAPVALTDRAQRVTAAMAERKAVKEWQRNGETGPKPPTPNMDAIADEHANPTVRATRQASRRAEGSTRRPVASGLRFHHDGRPMPDSQNKLSSIVYYYTKGIDGDRPRITTAEFVALLAEAGVTDPTNSEWEITLPNGIVISTTIG